MKYVKVYVEYAVRWKDAHGVARWFRRRGYEAHVRSGRVTVINEGAYKDALQEIHSLVRWVDPGAVATDWGVYEE